MLYWALLLILLITVGLNRLKFKTSKFGNPKDGKKIYIILASLLFVLLTGLRSTNVGMDTGMYHKLFIYMQGMASLKDAFSSWMLGGVEVGYAVVEYFFSKCLNFQCMLFFVAIISIVPTMIVLYRYSSNYWFSLFLYISFGFFSFTMNPIRQAIAMGICMIAYICAREKKLVLYICMIVLACLFHSSAIIFLPTYWLSKVKINKKTLIIYVSLLIGSNVFKHQFFLLINMFSRQTYQSSGDAGGERMYLFMLASLAIMILFQKDFIDDDKENNSTFLCMYAISTLIWPIASANAAVFRLYYYYQIFMIFCIPPFVQSIKKKGNKLIISAFFILVGCYFLHAYIINGPLKYSPYTFFWQY